MRRAVPVLLSLFLVTLAGWVLAPPASACSCVPATTQEQFEQADAVFTASLQSREVDDGSVHSSDDPALHVFTAHVVFKGDVHEAQAVVSAADSAACGIAVPDDEPVIVFATRSAELPEGRYSASLCGGTGPADPGVIAELTRLTELTTSTGAPGALPLEGGAGTESGGASPVLLGLGAAALLAVGVAGGLLLRRRRAGGADPG